MAIPQLHVEFSVREPDTQRFVTFTGDISLTELREWFVRAGLGVEQLFGSRGGPRAIRLLGAPTNKIQCIKLVRELTHIGLKEAKDLVEGCYPGVAPGTLMVCDHHDQANAVERRFLESGINVATEIIDVDALLVSGVPRLEGSLV